MGRRKLDLINQDNAPVQLSLLSAPGTENRGLEERYFPEITRDAAGFKEVLRRAEKLGAFGIDYEFRSYHSPTVTGIAVRDLAYGGRFDRTLHSYIKDAARSGIRLVAHSGFGADKPVFDAVEGFESPWEWWDDSMLIHWFENSHLTKAPGKEESDDSGAMGFMDLWTAASLVTKVPNWKECRGSACWGPCPYHLPHDYCAIDAWAGLEVFLVNRERLRKRGFEWRTYELRAELANYLHKMETRGVKIDREFVARFSNNLEALREGLFPVGENGEPSPFNPRSSQQVEAWFRERKVTLRSNQKNDIRKALEVTAARFGFASIEAVEQAETVPEVLSALHRLDQYKGSGKNVDSWFDEKYFDKESCVHPRFIYVGTSTGRLSSSRPNCFSGDTEVLTKTGWMSFEEAVFEEPEVATFNPKTYEIKFEDPQSWICVTGPNPMVHIYNRQVDLCVTEDHDCLVRHRRTGDFYTRKAAVYPSEIEQVQAGKYVGGQGASDSDAMIRFLVATQADGYFSGGGTITFGFTKARKILRMEEVLKELACPYTKRYKTLGVTVFYLPRSWATERAEVYLTEEKKFGPWILNFTPAQLKLFAEECFYWDGSGLTYSSTVRENVEWLQIAFALTGRRCSFLETPRTLPRQTIYSIGVALNRDFTNMTVREKDHYTSLENVYCCKVSTGCIVVRRKGKISITHQCQNIPSRGWGSLVKAAIVPHEQDFDIIDADLGQLELRDVLYQAGFDIRQIKGDAIQFIVEKGGAAFDRAAQIAGGEVRDIVKTVVYGGQYGEGLQIYTGADLMRPVVQREIAAGAVRLYTPQYVPWLTKAWEYGGGIVGFTGANLAERLFGDKSWESRKKALEIQDDLIFGGELRIIREWQIRSTEEMELKGYVRLQNTQFLRLNGSPRDNAKVGLAFKGQGLGAVHAQATMLACIRANNHLPLLQVHDSLVYAVNRSWSDRKVKEFIEPMFGETEVLPGFKAPGKVKRGANYGGFDKELNPGGLRLIWNSAKETVSGDPV